MWRLIHDNNKVYGLISDDNSKIHTNKTIFNGTTQEECFNKIDELKLNYTYYSGGTTEIIFSGGTRIIEDTTWVGS